MIKENLDVECQWTDNEDSEWSTLIITGFTPRIQNQVNHFWKWLKIFVLLEPANAGAFLYLEKVVDFKGRDSPPPTNTRYFYRGFV